MTLPIDNTLINSIKAIKQFCKSQKSCYDCPFSMKLQRTEECKFMNHIPKEWNIKINVDIEDLDV